jgi:hypothetical protein
MKSKGRGILDTPLARSMMVLGGANAPYGDDSGIPIAV